jgi:competence protein ComEC
VAGQQWDWDGVLWQVLHPAAGAQGDGNAASCVLRVRAANGAAVLLTGDIEAAQEPRCCAPASPASRLLLAPHHGSRTSSSAAFLAAVAPRTVVVQAGYRNRFGHQRRWCCSAMPPRHIAVQARPNAAPRTGRAATADVSGAQSAPTLLEPCTER